MTTSPLSAAAADLDLALPVDVERLLDRAERFALTHPLARLERRATQWCFDRLTAPPPGSPRERARRIREREWSLVDRVTIAWGRSVVEAMAADASFDVPPMERALVPALAGSQQNVFTVLSVRGGVADLVVARDGRHVSALARAVDVPMTPGALLIGRLIPLVPGAPWLCSPGMEVIKPPRLKLFSKKVMGTAFHDPIEDIDIALSLEIAVDRYWRKKFEHREPPPTETSEEAMALAREIHAALSAAGRAHLVESIGPHLHELQEEMFRYEYDVDDYMQEWISLVWAQALTGVVQRITERAEAVWQEEARASIHLPYFEVLAETEEATLEWAEVSSGLLVLRALDDVVRSQGDRARRATYGDKVREAIDAIDPSSAVRPVLERALDTIVTSDRADMKVVAPALLDYATVLEGQERWTLAREVYASVLRYTPPAVDPGVVARAEGRSAICAERTAR